MAAHAYLEEYETVAGREAVFTEEAHLALVRGELGRADETLRQAREAAERGGHVMGQVTIAALEAQLRAVEGDHAGACDAARRAREAAAATEEPGTRTEPVSWLAEAVLYGLPVEALPEGDHPLLAAARGGAVAEEGPPAGRRAATLAYAWRVWRADAAMRDGESAAALDLASAAARDARAFGHVWLEIAALGRVCAWSADADAPSRRDALLRKAAESLPSPADRPRLVDAWRVRDQSI